MDISLMELIWTFKTNQKIMLFVNGQNISGLIYVRELIEKDYLGYTTSLVDFIQPEIYGGLFGFKETKYIEIYLR